jgi:hypothetical protein
VLARLAKSPRVVWAEPAVRFSSDFEPNDQCWNACVADGQWNFRKVGVPAAWDTTRGDPNVLVAVLDTGVDTTHPELPSPTRVLVGGDFHNDYYSSNPASADYCSPMDLVEERAHATHVAGTIAASTNNGPSPAGVTAGLGWLTRALSIKVLDDCGLGTQVEVAAGIFDAINRGASVINLSLTGPTDTRTLREAVSAAQAAGVLVVAAAGNFDGVGSLEDVRYPAGYPGVVSVAATDRNDNLASFSHRGPWVSMAAPGVGILSTVPMAYRPSGYDVFNGTSMATPHVAAAAALLLATDRRLTPGDLRARLARSAARIGGTGTSFAWGRLDVAGLFQVAPPEAGYWLAAADGGMFSFNRPFFGSGSSSAGFNRPVVGIAPTGTGQGYWMVTDRGAVLEFGDAGFAGDLARMGLNAPVLGIEPVDGDGGYWLVGADGGIFSFGSARFFGSMGAQRLNQPIVGMAGTSTGRGYWLVARDGGIFAFGDARFWGSTGGMVLNKPVVGMASTPSGNGYWLVASDGGIFAFGDAAFKGSTGAMVLNRPIVGMRCAPSGDGYYLVATDGGIFAFGDAPFKGSTGALVLNQPIVGMAS